MTFITLENNSSIPQSLKPTTRVIQASELTENQIAIWSRIQETNLDFASPYFRPEFTQAVAAVRNDVEIGLLENATGEPVGFFPFQRQRSRIGQPLGGRLSDFHGVIVPNDIDWNAKTLVRECGLREWNFDHLIASQAPFESHQFRQVESPYLDLSQGFEAYRQARRKAGSKRIEQTLRKGRKLAKDIGEVRFVSHTDDPKVFEQLIEWKSEQYRQSRLIDLFTFDWIRNLLQQTLTKSNNSFRGMMSVLYVGDRIAAIDFGIRSHHILHYWFPSYDRALSQYSPGHLLLTNLAQAAEDLGIKEIHLGKGEESYKTSFTNASVKVAEGTVDLNPVKRFVKHNWHRTREMVKQSPLRSLLRQPVRLFRRMFDQISMY